MEKLQLRHIASYLPYGLKCQLNRLGVFNLDEEYPIPHNDICEITNLIKVGNDWEIEISGSGYCSFGMIGLDEIEIFLRPLSDLYKEIDGVVGIVDLAKIAFPNYEWVLRSDRAVRLDAQTEYFEYDGDFLAGDGWDYYQIPNQLDLFTYLFQHHYDIFGLIDKGLAIDKNSIE